MAGHEHHNHDGHDHAHGVGLVHAHAPKNFGAAFAIGTALNLGFIIAEVIYGLLANSIALVADAGHNLGDVLGLVMAWVAAVLARARPHGPIPTVCGAAPFWLRSPMLCCYW